MHGGTGVPDPLRGDAREDASDAALDGDGVRDAAEGASDHAVHVHGATKRFGRRQVLHGTTFTVRRQEIVGFVGPNGAGKTTCLRLLVGLVRRDGGQVHVLGSDPARDSLAIRRRCCYLSGETSLYQHMTGAQFLRFALRFYPRLRHDLQREMLDRFALPLGRRIRAYSAGMKQKLALIATLVPDVDLYVLDEPDRMLDAPARSYLREVLAGLRTAGKTILLSSHHLTEIEALVDRLVVLLDGRVVPAQRVQRAQAVLRRQVRLRLPPGAAVPAGGRAVHVDPDGTLHLDVGPEPLLWIGGLDRRQVAAAETGNVRLEDLYRELLRDDAGGDAAGDVRDHGARDVRGILGARDASGARADQGEAGWSERDHARPCCDPCRGEGRCACTCHPARRHEDTAR